MAPLALVQRAPEVGECPLPPAALLALWSRPASGAPTSIQTCSAPVRSRTASAGVSASAIPREKVIPSAYSRQYASTREIRYSSVSDG